MTLVSGWKGGFIIPLFFMGATLGELVHLVTPGHERGGRWWRALMVALCVGVTKTPLGTTLVVTEMAGSRRCSRRPWSRRSVALVLSSRPVTLIDSPQRPEPSTPEPATEVGG